MDCEGGARGGRGHCNWMRMLLTQALLLSCLSLRSSAVLLAFGDKANAFCKDKCFLERGSDASMPCNSSITAQMKDRTCDMDGNQEMFRINVNDKALWNALYVTNASTVKLEATKLAQKIYLKSVPSIVLDSTGTQGDGFSYLRLDDCQIGENYTLSFVSLKELHIVGSTIGVIMQTSMNEIDILNDSQIRNLSAGIEKSRSTFRDSTLNRIEMLHIYGTAKLVMTNMTIHDLHSLKYSSSASSTVDLSRIEKITSLISQPASGELEFNEVKIGEIVSNGVTIMGKVKISNSVIYKSPIDGILISGSGEITFRNATINGVQLSYTLKADPSSNATITALHLSVITFRYAIVYWVIIAVMAVGIAVLLYFVIKLLVARRSWKAADDSANKNLESVDPGKISVNYYTRNIKSEAIPMSTRNESEPTGQAGMPQRGGPVSQEFLASSHLSASQDSFDVSLLPPPPPQMLSNRANTPQPTYEDVVGGESDTKKSFLYNINKASVGQKKNFPHSSEAQTSKQAPKPMFPPQIPSPVASPPALPVPSHYATRGLARPPPPPRKPPSHMQILQPKDQHGLPPGQFHTDPAANLSDYQDTVEEEPLYATEEELRNY